MNFRVFKYIISTKIGKIGKVMRKEYKRKRILRKGGGGLQLLVKVS